uniref:La-related protein 1A-like isoform X1 n=1 Tax=Rhizophora mucronata TaxID=61149 RepID=A0A2P2J1L9_RHIMU
MVMADIEAGDDHKDLLVAATKSGPAKSPWKTPVLADAQVMGAESESWPALSDAQQQHQYHRSKINDSVADGSAAAATPPPPPQGFVGQHKSHGSGNPIYSHKNSSSRHQKSGSKRSPNGPPPFPVPFPYTPPYMQPVFHAVVPPPHIPISGYPYQPGPGPFPGIENHLVKSGSETSPMQPFVTPPNVQPPMRGESNAYMANIPNRRPNMGESGSHLSHTWHHQGPFGPGDVLLQQGMGPRPLLRPSFFAPAPVFMIGPTLPGPPMCYLPAPPPGSFRGPHPPRFIPYPLNLGVPVHSPEMLALRANIVKQIEYYFSDENLQTDHYLISCMDDQGWVPISIIADFKRVSVSFR